LRLGATVTISDLEEHAEVKSKFPGLAEAAASIATPQIRHLGTVGGISVSVRAAGTSVWKPSSVAKRVAAPATPPRVRTSTNAIFDTGPSNIVHPSDLAPMLVALNATVTIMGAGGSRTISLEDFFITPDKDVRHENILRMARS